jgi:hypothetical protein
MRHLSLVLTLMALGAAPSFAAAIDHNVLLEASGTTAPPKAYDGSVEWSRGADRSGVPILTAKVRVPDRDLTLELLLRKNDDASLPASHLFEIAFKPGPFFAGDGIAGLNGILAKDEELEQGSPLVGASARVVGNTFLFALSGSAEDTEVNAALLRNGGWIDLAITYATGRRAIVTLEKDATAQLLFREVLSAWAAKPPVPAKSRGSLSRAPMYPLRSPSMPAIVAE